MPVGSLIRKALRHAWLPRLAALLVSVVVGVLFVEVALYMTGTDEARLWEPDPVLGWRHVDGAERLYTDEGRGHVRVNALRQRDRERDLVKGPGTFRIGVFGDSMTEAIQVDLERTFPYLIEERLNADGIKVELLNFGVSGYSPIQELLVFQQVADRYDLDMAVLALFLDNDISGCHPQLSVVTASGPPFAKRNSIGIGELVFDFSLAEQSYRDYHREPVHSIRKYSGLYRRLRTAKWSAGERGGVTGAGVPLRYRLYDRDCDAIWEDAWKTFEAAILTFSADAKRRNIPLVLVSVPAAQIADTGSWENILAQRPAMADVNWNLYGPEERLVRFAAEHHLQLAQPLEAFRKARKQPPLYFGNVGHMTARGHVLMADVLAPYIRNRIPGVKSADGANVGRSISQLASPHSQDATSP